MLGRIAVRMAAVEALRGRTEVGDNVLDSEIGALDVAADGTLRSDQDRPFISVYVEGGKVNEAMDLRQLHRSGWVDLLFEYGITIAMAETDPETGESQVVTGIPATDGAMELYLDVIGRQIVNALSDPSNEWAEIWRSLMSRIVTIERRRAASAISGTRIAAQQLVITVEMLPDPVYGEPLGPMSAWAAFFARLDKPTMANPAFDPDDPDSPALIIDPLVARKALLFRSLMGLPDGVLAHEAQRRRFGLTLEEARAMLDMAVRQGEATEPDIESVGVTITPAL